MLPAACEEARPDLRSLFSFIRRHTEQLCAPLRTEDFIPQPCLDVSPVRWHIAHTTWFFEEMVLRAHQPGYQNFDPTFDFLFNSYYNSVGDRTPRGSRGDLSRPTVEEVFAYRRYVDERMLELLACPDAPSELVMLGLNHEQQHQELILTDIKYTFGVNPILPAYREGWSPELETETSTVGFIEVEGGVHEVGHSGRGFCFDNELARHGVLLQDFEISKRLVTNAQFLEFIRDGGYRDHRLWHSEGWDWISQNAVAAPLHWQEGSVEGEISIFTLGGLQPFAPDAPVCHVSFYEAAAFAEWQGMRLPTEFEWEAASRRLEWGLRWEWTNSAYLPYPGFRKPLGAVGEYNAKFMANQMVLRGASIATPAGHSRHTYRNFFHPHLRWQFTGIRLCRE
jgi:ergothioneine biosynthesis protein EgtB